jgi:NodT family efflux transporter outer membrane factor (OMF) lipoprotein
MRLDWWTAFRSPDLDRMVGEALAANHDLAAADANLKAARALAGEARANRGPQGGVSAGADRMRESALAQPPIFGTPDRFPSQTMARVGGELAWELDLAGGLAKSARAAAADADAALWERRQIEAAVAAQTVRAWLDLGRARNLGALLDQRLEALDAAVRMLERRASRGAGTDADVAALRRVRAEAAASRPALDQAQRNALRRIAVLTGRDPVAFVGIGAALTGDAVTPTTLTVGEPRTLLRQRPDVQIAERRLAASFERAGASRAALYPSLSLGALAGLAAEPADLDRPGALRFAVGPSISWGIFNLGRVRAQIRASDAQSEAAAAQWQQSLLTALEEADGAIDGWRTARATATAARLAEAAAEVASTAARARFRAGAASPFDLAAAEADLLVAEAAAAEAEAAERAAWAETHLALGAGWRPDPRPATSRGLCGVRAPARLI